MLLAFGITAEPAPSVLPTTLIHMLGSGITLDRFILAGIVILLGAGGKMGPSLARMARRGSDAAGAGRRGIGVSR